jgi:hypothetical protein
VVGGPDVAEVWDPNTMSFSDAGTLEGAGWWGTTTLMPDGRVLVVGGFTGDGYPGEGTSVGDAALWDASTMAFSPAGSLTETRGMHTATLLPDGHVLLVGGATTGLKPVSGGESWDPTSRSFRSAAPLEEARAGHTTTLMPDGSVLVIGGGGPAGGGTALASTELWAP